MLTVHVVSSNADFTPFDGAGPSSSLFPFVLFFYYAEVGNDRIADFKL